MSASSKATPCIDSGFLRSPDASLMRIELGFRMITAAVRDTQAAQCDPDSKKVKDSKRKERRQEMRRIVQKVVFLAAWANEQSSEVYDSLSTLVEREVSRVQRQTNSQHQYPGSGEFNTEAQHIESKFLVTEVNNAEQASKPPSNPALLPGNQHVTPSRITVLE